jgi:type I restriction enzyme S subunit
MSDLKPGWKRVKFGEVVRQVKSKADPETSGLERYVAGEHMDTDDLRIRRWGTIGEGYLGPAFHAHFMPGQVLYGSRRTYLRKVAVADFEGICANTTFVLESANPKVLLPELLPFIMQTEGFHEHSKRESKGSVNPYVNFSDLAWYEFALPPLVEQRRISETLSIFFAIVEAMRSALSAADSCRKSFLVDVFRQNRGSHDVFPPHWARKTAREVGSIQLGQQRHPSFDTGSNMRKYLRVANVMDGFIDLGDVMSMHFPLHELGKFELLPGDILLNEGQSTDLVGRSAIYRGEIPGACFQKTLLRFRCSDILIPDFAHAFFQHMLYTKQFARICVQTTSIAHLTAVRFASIPMPIPPANEQSSIAERAEQLGTSSKRVAERLDQAKQSASQIVNSLLGRSDNGCLARATGAETARTIGSLSHSCLTREQNQSPKGGCRGRISLGFWLMFGWEQTIYQRPTL